MTNDQEMAKFLICVNDDQIAEELELCLKRIGYHDPVRAGAGERALAWIEQNPPDLVIMDIAIEGELDGIKAAEAIWDKFGIPLVFIVDRVDTDRIEYTKPAYPFGYIFKPFRDRELEIAVDMALYVAEVDAERRKAEERSRIFFEKSRDAIFIVSRDSKFVDVNEAATHLSGYSRDELLEMEISDLHDDIDLQAYNKFFSTIMNGEPVTSEAKILRKDGGKVDTEFSNTRIMIDNDYYMHTIARDITDRKLAEDALRQSEERYRTVIESMSDTLSIIDAEGNFLFANQKAVKNITGRSPENVFGQNIKDFMPIEQAEEFLSNYRNSIKTRQPFMAEVKSTMSGEERWFLNRLTPIQYGEGGVPAVISMSLDITERKRVEQRLEKTAESLRQAESLAKLGYFERNWQTNKAVWSDGFFRLLGLHDQKTHHTHEEFMDYIHPEDRDRVGAHIQKSLVSKKPMDIEFRIVQKGGNVLDIHGIAKNRYDENGEPLLTLGIFQDVTERNQAEKALRESEERFELAVGFTNDGLFDWNLETNEMFYSPGWKRMLGYEDDEIANKFSEWERLTESEGARAALIMLNELLERKREHYEIEFKMMHKNGHWVDVLSRANVVFDENGVGVRVVGTHVDITKRKQAEQALKESEGRFRSIIELSPFGIGIVDSEGTLINCNNALADMLGYTTDELIGFPFERFSHPDDINRERELIDRLWGNNESHYKIETRYIQKNGNTIWVNVTAALVRDGDGKGINGHVFVEDISERKKMEEKLKKSESTLRKIFEILPVGLWITDKEGNLLSGNPKGVEIWGAEPHVGQEEYSVFKARRLPSREEIAPEDWALAHTINKGVTVENEMIEIDAFDGKTRTVLNFTAPVIDDDGLLLGAIVVNQDITELKFMDDALKKSLVEKEVLLQEINHRVKNNMQVIISLMNLQSHSFENEQLKEALLESQSRIYAMAAVHEILHQSENLTRVDLAQYFTRLSETIFQTYRTDIGNIKISLDINPIDVALEQSYPVGLVFNELLSNATKHAFPDNRGGEIRVLAEHQGPQTIRLEISDNGVGLPDDFDWKNRDSLGLRIIRALVEDQLGGTIDLDSANGARWEITFPI